MYKIETTETTKIIKVKEKIVSEDTVVPIELLFFDEGIEVRVGLRCLGYNDYQKEIYRIKYDDLNACVYNAKTKTLCFFGTIGFSIWQSDEYGNVIASEAKEGTMYNYGTCTIVGQTPEVINKIRENTCVEITVIE